MTEVQAGPHEVTFISFPKLLFIWPIILAGFLFWPFTAPVPLTVADAPSAATESTVTPPAADLTATDPNAVPATQPAALVDEDTGRAWWLETFGWAYVWVLVFVLLAIGIDLDRNQTIVVVIVLLALWILGVWLQDSKGFNLFGNIYRWFDARDVQYDRSLGLVVSVILLVPYLFMLFWARLDSRWRITHNEFEHYSFGRMDDALGRGAKTIRSSYPDALEMLLGLSGTLIVFNATGTKELRRIPHVMFLPLVRKRLNLILERTAVTAAQFEEEEEEGDDDNA